MNKTEIERIISRRHESLDFEIKEWLNLTEDNGKYTLIKAICALTNHGGGYILIGCDDTPPHNPHPCPENIDISEYEQNKINGLIKRHVEPSFHIELYECDMDNKRQFLIKVSFSFGTPVRINDKGDETIWKRNTYFIRKEGPKSEPPYTGKEWDDFLNAKMLLRKSDLLSSIERLIKGTNTEISNPDKPFEDWVSQNLSLWKTQKLTKSNIGYYWMAFKLSDFSFNSLKDIVSTVTNIKTYTGWPPFFYQSSNTKVKDDKIETYTDFKGISSHKEYWAISKTGYFFIVHVFQEDCGDFTLHPNAQNTKFIDFTLPIWRTAEKLLFAFQAANKNHVEFFKIQFGWSGLENRVLGSRYSAGTNIVYTFPNAQKATIKEYKTPIYDMETKDIEVNLKDNVHKILQPLYEQFDLTQLDKASVSSQIDLFLKGI